MPQAAFLASVSRHENILAKLTDKNHHKEECNKKLINILDLFDCYLKAIIRDAKHSMFH